MDSDEDKTNSLRAIAEAVQNITNALVPLKDDAERVRVLQAVAVLLGLPEDE